MAPASAKRILLGRISAAHGIRGDVLVKSYAAAAADIAAYGPLSSADGMRSFRLKALRTTAKGGVICHIAGVDDRNAAEALAGTDLYVDRARLPPPADGEYYHVDLIGLSAVDPYGELLGEVIAIHNYGASDLLEVRVLNQPATELVPLTESFVLSVDLAAGRIVVALPQTAPDDDTDDEILQK